MPVPALSKSLKPRAQYGSVDDDSRIQSLRSLVKTEDSDTNTSDTIPLKMRPSLVRPLSFQSGSEPMKRRSLLPQPGQHREVAHSYAHSTSSLTETTTTEPVASGHASVQLLNSTSAIQEAIVRTAIPGRLRPRSMYQTGIASSQQVQDGDKPALRSMRPPASVSKPLEPQTLRPGRSQSLCKPSVSTQADTVAVTTAHSRTKSTGTGAPIRKDGSKPKLNSERPKSLATGADVSLKLAGLPMDMVSSRPVGLNHSISIKTKSEVLSGGASTDTAPRADNPLTTQPRRRGLVPEEPNKTNRPIFTTLQQHFTPRKVGKAPTATFLHPTTATGAASLAPETVNLQAELIQLQILHQSSTHVCKSWELSAMRGLRLRFEEVASLYQAMLEYERASQEQINLQSLLQWSVTGTAQRLVEQVQILSESLHELPALVEQGGRLQRLVCDFEQWVMWIQELRSARQEARSDRDVSGTIEGLGGAWRSEIASLTRKLSSLSRDLDQLEAPPLGSSIACMSETCKSLLQVILAELQIMQMIEADVVLEEKAWAESRLKAIAKDQETHLMMLREQDAAWRV